MTTSCSLSDRQALIAHLRGQVQRIEGLRQSADGRPVSTGSPPLDRLLPAGGLMRSSLVEYLSPGPGSGAGTLALAAAREACANGRALVVIDRSRTFYPPAAAAWGIDLSQMFILQPVDRAAELWALDQALRCSGVGAVYASCAALDVRDFRRLQLAAESGGTLGVLVRSSRFRGQPSWADVQWQLGKMGQACAASADPRGMEVRLARTGISYRSKSIPRGSALALASLTHPTWQLRVELVRCRGGPGGQVAELELDEATGIWQDARTSHAAHPESVPAELAHSARPRRA
jgi:protein ImuA